MGEVNGRICNGKKFSMQRTLPEDGCHEMAISGRPDASKRTKLVQGISRRPTVRIGTKGNPVHVEVEQSEESRQKKLRRFLDSSLLGNTWQACEAFQTPSKRGINMLSESHQDLIFRRLS